MINLLILIIGFAGGLAVGSGFVAFLAVLGVIPRLLQVTKTYEKIHFYEFSVVLGALCGSVMSLNFFTLSIPSFFLAPIGLLSGVFIGLLAAALTEMLNVFPLLTKRMGLDDRLMPLLMAFVFGKVFGSLFQWLYFHSF
jgi:stage V sporulation protein AB